MSILCERCWQELGTPLARLPFYLAHLDYWHRKEMERYGEYCPRGPHQHGSVGHWGTSREDIVWAVQFEPQ